MQKDDRGSNAFTKKYQHIPCSFAYVMKSYALMIDSANLSFSTEETMQFIDLLRQFLEYRFCRRLIKKSCHDYQMIRKILSQVMSAGYVRNCCGR